MNKATTKRERDLLLEACQKYLMSNWENIYQAYERPSSLKSSAWERCQQICNEYNGNNLRVVSKNINVFTAGFMAELDKKKVFVYITRDHVRYVEM